MLLRMKCARVLSLIVLTAIAQIADADNYETFNHIKEVTKNFVAQNMVVEPDETANIEVSDANANFKLPTCTKEITAKLPDNASKSNFSNVELTCDGEKSWHVFVPVNIQISSKVVVAKQTIPSNETIIDSDLEFAEQDKNRLYNGYYKAKEEIIGYKTVHLMTPGTVFTRKDIQAVNIVLRNQMVNLIAKKNTVVVSIKGIAKSDGTLNSVIKVFNPSSKQIVDATVTGPNQAEVLM